MNTIQLIRSKNKGALYNIINWVFLLSGGKIYLDYILITNPISKNPLIKVIYGWMSKAYTASDYNMRYYSAYVYGGVHVVLFIMHAVANSIWSISNILVNAYPIIVQLYIGYRCYRIKSSKYKA